MNQSAGSITTQCSRWYKSLPLGTRCIFTTCVAIYILAVFVGFDNYRLICMSPYFIIHNYQVHRALTAVLFHGGLLHIAFNMLAFAPLGSSLERSIGTVRYCHTVLLFTGVAAALHTMLGWFAAANPFFPIPQEMYRCSIGFSGVIFGLITVDTQHSSTQQRSIFGFFTVPSRFYPWALLLLFQMLMPQVSFLGHLSGLLAGLLYCNGYLQWVLLGKQSVQFAEAKLFTAFPGWSDSGSSAFVRMPTSMDGFLPWANHMPSPTQSASPPDLQPSIQGVYAQRLKQWISGSNSTSNTQSGGGVFSGRSHTLGSGSSGGTSSQGTPVVGGGGAQLGPTFAQMPNKMPTQQSSAGEAGGSGVGSSQSMKGAIPPPMIGGIYGPPSVTIAYGPSPGAESSASSSSVPLSTSTKKGKLPMIISEQSVRQLVDMGFEEGVAFKALEASNGDITMAIEILT